MPIPFVIDNQQHRMSDALNELLAQSVGKPLDIATAYLGRMSQWYLSDVQPDRMTS